MNVKVEENSIRVSRYLQYIKTSIYRENQLGTLIVQVSGEEILFPFLREKLMDETVRYWFKYGKDRGMGNLEIHGFYGKNGYRDRKTIDIKEEFTAYKKNLVLRHLINVIARERKMAEIDNLQFVFSAGDEYAAAIRLNKKLLLYEIEYHNGFRLRCDDERRLPFYSTKELKRLLETEIQKEIDKHRMRQLLKE